MGIFGPPMDTGGADGRPDAEDENQAQGRQGPEKEEGRIEGETE